MEERPESTRHEPERGSLAESWKEVGEQLKELGSRLASAFRVAWSEEKQSEQEETIRNLQNDLRAAADRLERVVKRVADETEEERTATVKATREASEVSLGEARTASMSALRTLNSQLEQLLNRMEREPEQEPKPGAEKQQAQSQSQAQPAAPQGPSPDQPLTQTGTGTATTSSDTTPKHPEPTPEP